VPEYLPKTKAISAYLNPGGQLKLSFPVKKPGLIVVKAFAKWDRFPLDPTKRKVEIFKPGSASPVAQKTDPGWNKVTFLTYAVSASAAGLAGDWVARVTNLENSREQFRLEVSYPSDIPVKTYSVPASVVSAFVNSTVGKIQIRVTDGTNASYVKFPPSLGVPQKTFTAPRFSKKINLPFVPDIKITERVNDIHSQSVSFSLQNATAAYANGSMRLGVKFEEAGKEIVGTFNGDMKKMDLTVNLGLETYNRMISYNTTNVGVSFPCEVDIAGIPDAIERWVLDPILGYTDKVRSGVVNAVKSVFAGASMRSAFSTAIMDKVGPFLGSNPKVVSVKVEAGVLKVKYYNA
jgi:hypothetical protein